MAASLLDGNRLAAEIKAEVAEEVRRLASEGVRPGLAAVLVGHDPASEVYVRSKVKTCESLGLFSEKITPPATISTPELITIVEQLNSRDDIDGILVQLPLPPQVDAKAVLLAVSPEKDVDGFHPVNVGRLSTQRAGLVPCTPLGCMEILKRYGVAVAGQNAVVIGRSDIVGKPMAMLLTNANATVTIAHSKTHDLPALCRTADILVAAIGRPGFVTRDFVKPGAAVIDVGINRVTDRETVDRLFAHGSTRDEKRLQQFEEKGSVLAGDVATEVMEVAGALTPVPGGVGPLTIAMLMSNTVTAAKLRRMARGGAALQEIRQSSSHQQERTK